MGIRFYKKRSPGTKVALSNGEGIPFTTLDNVIGYFATTAETVQQEFERFMVEGRYDITEIDPAEFTRDYVEKKKGGSDLKTALAGRANAVTSDAIRINPQRESGRSAKCCGRG